MNDPGDGAEICGFGCADGVAFQFGRADELRGMDRVRGITEQIELCRRCGIGAFKADMLVATADVQLPALTYRL